MHFQLATFYFGSKSEKNADVKSVALGRGECSLLSGGKRSVVSAQH